MQDLARGAALAYNASVVLRIGSAVFVVCPDERLQSLYYRVDGGVRSVWRHLRGSEISPRLLQDAEEANRTLWERAPALPLPEEFLAGYRDLAAATLAYLDRDEATSREEISARAIETVGFLEAGLDTATGAVDFERSCQAATGRVPQSGVTASATDDPSAPTHCLQGRRSEAECDPLHHERGHDRGPPRHRVTPRGLDRGPTVHDATGAPRDRRVGPGLPAVRETGVGSRPRYVQLTASREVGAACGSVRATRTNIYTLEAWHYRDGTASYRVSSYGHGVSVRVPSARPDVSTSRIQWIHAGCTAAWPLPGGHPGGPVRLALACGRDHAAEIGAKSSKEVLITGLIPPGGDQLGERRAVMADDPVNRMAQFWATFDESLRMGNGFDETTYDALTEALRVCANEWAEQDAIPRLGANILVDIFPATEANAALYKAETADRVMEAAYELHDLVGECVALH